MNEFKIELKNDKEFLDLVWINYIGNRDFREKIAEKKWNELYVGKTENFLEIELKGLNFLNRFSDFSKNNEKFCTKLLKKYFSFVRKKIKLDINIDLSNDFYNKDNNNNIIEKKDENYFKMWENINSEIEEIFSIEYEKMKRIMDIFKDVSIFSQVGWDLSKFNKEDMFNISNLNDTLAERKEIIEFLDNIGKIENYKNTHCNNNYSNEHIEIDLNNNLSKLLPSELVNFHNPLLKKYFYIKYIEKSLLNYSMTLEKKSKIKNNVFTKKGPIILCIDTSSSMIGLPEEISKSISLYLLKKSYKEKRKIYLIAFGSIDEIMEYDLTDEKLGLYNALNFFKMGFYGGTDFVSPLKKSFSLIKDKKYRNSDLLFITDGLGKIPNDFTKQIEEEKIKENTKIFSILINENKTDLKFIDKILYYPIKNINNNFKKNVPVYDVIGHHYSFLDKE